MQETARLLLLAIKFLKTVSEAKDASVMSNIVHHNDDLVVEQMFHKIKASWKEDKEDEHNNDDKGHEAEDNLAIPKHAGCRHTTESLLHQPIASNLRGSNNGTDKTNFGKTPSEVRSVIYWNRNCTKKNLR